MLNLKKITMIGCIFFVSLGFTGCSGGSLDLNVNVDDNLITTKQMTMQKVKTSTEELNIDQTSAQGFEVAINMGQVTIQSGDDEEVNIDVDYEVKGEDKETLADILDAVSIKYEEKKDDLIISVVNKDTNENIWDWIRDTYGNRNGVAPNLNVYLEITLPKQFNVFDIQNAMGEIDLENLTGSFHIDNAMGQTNLRSVKGEFQINNAMGKVAIKNVEFEGESEIIVNMGDLECSLSKTLEKSSDVKLEADMGNITINTNGLSYTSKESGDNFMGESKTILVQKLCSISTEVAMGNVSVRK